MSLVLAITELRDHYSQSEFYDLKRQPNALKAKTNFQMPPSAAKAEKQVLQMRKTITTVISNFN